MGSSSIALRLIVASFEPERAGDGEWRPDIGIREKEEEERGQGQIWQAKRTHEIPS